MAERLERGAVERRRAENAALRRRIDVLKERHETALAEMRHRFANCFQLLAADIQLRARQSETDEARKQLARVHDRVVALALLQTPLALIVHELVTNGLEHAFPEGTGGTIRITLKTGREQTGGPDRGRRRHGPAAEP